jgi:hypothetical protein
VVLTTLPNSLRPFSHPATSLNYCEAGDFLTTWE